MVTRRQVFIWHARLLGSMCGVYKEKEWRLRGPIKMQYKGPEDNESPTLALITRDNEVIEQVVVLSHDPEHNTLTLRGNVKVKIGDVIGILPPNWATPAEIPYWQSDVNLEECGLKRKKAPMDTKDE